MGSERNEIGKSDTNRKFVSELKDLKRMKYIRSLSRLEVMAYIKKLHKIIKKQLNKIAKYKNEIKLLAEKGCINDCNKESTNGLTDKPKTFVEEIREAAEVAQNENGFVYEPTSGLYYDRKTGYYYNAEYGLYYNGDNGCYYHYNQEKNEFEFHSQVQELRNTEDKDEKIQNFYKPEKDYSEEFGKSKKKRNKNNYEENINDVKKESGEMLSTFDGDVVTELKENSNNEDSKYEDLAQKYPPSLRIIVQESNSPQIRVGTLYLITYKGGTLGREGNHDVLIPDTNISKYHLRFSYNKEKEVYQCIDLGSRNGTFLNGKRMSTAKQESESLDIIHGSTLQISCTKLLCHIHSGNNTCGHCEPGLLMEQSKMQKVVSLPYKEQLKILQKKYGLENEKYIEVKENPQYNNRAETRRNIIGSSSDYEKTQMVSVDSEISSENKGFKILSKLGWNKGQTLGKKNNGILEPIAIINNKGVGGLGCITASIPVEINKKSVKKLIALQKTQERFNKLSKKDTFSDDDEESN